MLVDLIQDGVGSYDEWLDEESTVREINGNLVVKTTADNHDAVHALLAQLRRSQAEDYRRQLVLIEVFVLLKEAEDARLDQDYAAALSAIDQALRVDPENPEATAMREVVVATLGRGE